MRNLFYIFLFLLLKSQTCLFWRVLLSGSSNGEIKFWNETNSLNYSKILSFEFLSSEILAKIWNLTDRTEMNNSTCFLGDSKLYCWNFTNLNFTLKENLSFGFDFLKVYKGEILFGKKEHNILKFHPSQRNIVLDNCQITHLDVLKFNNKSRLVCACKNKQIRIFNEK